MSGGQEHSFLTDTRLLGRSIELADCSKGETVFVVGGSDGQLASNLGECSSSIIAVEPDPQLASYLYSLELYRTMVIHAAPHAVLKDAPFDKLLCLQPKHVDERFLSSLLGVSFSQGVVMMPDDVYGAFRARDKLGVLLRASFDADVVRSVPKTSFSPSLSFAASLVALSPSTKKDAVSSSLRLLFQEAGTMRGLLTRSCREYFGYTLAEAQDAVRMLNADLLKKRFWDVSEDEFKSVVNWLKLG